MKSFNCIDQIRLDSMGVVGSHALRSDREGEGVQPMER